MNGTVRELMTPDPVAVDESTPLQQVALVMREEDIGDVIVERAGRPAGIVTDRDIVVRALAEGEDARTLQAGDICTGDVLSVSPDDAIDDAARLMREAAVRRVPVIDESTRAAQIRISRPLAHGQTGRRGGGGSSTREVCGEREVSETVVSPRTLGPAWRRHRAWSRRFGAIDTKARHK